MAGAKQKLELTWIGKEKRPLLEPRILMPDDALSHHATARVGAGDRFDNLLIQGDNLLALKALEAEFAGQVKCIYIDPPYNTGSAFEHYDDGVEHSVWLTLLRDRLEMLWPLLAEEGSLWINIDDNKAHYLKVLCDEVLGRKSFIANLVWQKRTSRENPDYDATHRPHGQGEPARASPPRSRHEQPPARRRTFGHQASPLFSPRSIFSIAFRVVERP